MRTVISLVSGGLFGLGLVVSDMIDPARVLSFLTVTSGAWDPTLAFVMGGAMLPMFFAWRIATRMEAPSHGTSFPGKPSGVIDRSLILGAAIFGLGWGLVGLCPGPALAGLTVGGWPVWLFVGSMIVGMVAKRFVTVQVRPA